MKKNISPPRLSSDGDTSQSSSPSSSHPRQGIGEEESPQQIQQSQESPRFGDEEDLSSSSCSVTSGVDTLPSHFVGSNLPIESQVEGASARSVEPRAVEETLSPPSVVEGRIMQREEERKTMNEVEGSSPGMSEQGRQSSEREEESTQERRETLASSTPPSLVPSLPQTSPSTRSAAGSTISSQAHPLEDSLIGRRDLSHEDSHRGEAGEEENLEGVLRFRIGGEREAPHEGRERNPSAVGVGGVAPAEAGMSSSSSLCSFNEISSLHTNALPSSSSREEEGEGMVRVQNLSSFFDSREGQDDVVGVKGGSLHPLHQSSISSCPVHDEPLRSSSSLSSSSSSSLLPSRQDTSRTREASDGVPGGALHSTGVFNESRPSANHEENSRVGSHPRRALVTAAQAVAEEMLGFFSGISRHAGEARRSRASQAERREEGEEEGQGGSGGRNRRRRREGEEEEGHHVGEEGDSCEEGEDVDLEGGGEQVHDERGRSLDDGNYDNDGEHGGSERNARSLSLFTFPVAGSFEGQGGGLREGIDEDAEEEEEEERREGGSEERERMDTEGGVSLMSSSYHDEGGGHPLSETPHYHGRVHAQEEEDEDERRPPPFSSSSFLPSSSPPHHYHGRVHSSLDERGTREGRRAEEGHPSSSSASSSSSRSNRTTMSSSVRLPSCASVPTFFDDVDIFLTKAQLLHLLQACKAHLEHIDSRYNAPRLSSRGTHTTRRRGEAAQEGSHDFSSSSSPTLRGKTSIDTSFSSTSSSLQSTFSSSSSACSPEPSVSSSSSSSVISPYGDGWIPDTSRSASSSSSSSSSSPSVSLPTLEEAVEAYGGSLPCVSRLLTSLLKSSSSSLFVLASYIIVSQLRDPHLLLTLISSTFTALGDTEAYTRLLPCLAPLNAILTPPLIVIISPSPSSSSTSGTPTASQEGEEDVSSPYLHPIPFSRLPSKPSSLLSSLASSYISSLSSLPLARSRCDQVWDGEHVAYRCLTCGGSQSSCICVFCFQEGNHLGHSYFIYRSSCGGCCDCGDASAWNPKGFCRHHPGSSKHIDPSAALSYHTKFVLLLLLRVLVRRLTMYALEKKWKETQLLCDFLLQLSEQHEGIRRCIGKVMLEGIRGSLDDSKGFTSLKIAGKDRVYYPPNYIKYDGWYPLFKDKARIQLFPCSSSSSSGGVRTGSREKQMPRKALSSSSSPSPLPTSTLSSSSSSSSYLASMRLQGDSPQSSRDISSSLGRAGLSRRASAGPPEITSSTSGAQAEGEKKDKERATSINSKARMELGEEADDGRGERDDTDLFFFSGERELAFRAAEGSRRAEEATKAAEEARKQGERMIGGIKGERRMIEATEREKKEIELRRQRGGVNVKSFHDALKFAMCGGRGSLHNSRSTQGRSSSSSSQCRLSRGVEEGRREDQGDVKMSGIEGSEEDLGGTPEEERGKETSQEGGEGIEQKKTTERRRQREGEKNEEREDEREDMETEVVKKDLDEEDMIIGDGVSIQETIDAEKDDQTTAEVSLFSSSSPSLPASSSPDQGHIPSSSSTSPLPSSTAPSPSTSMSSPPSHVYGVGACVASILLHVASEISSRIVEDEEGRGRRRTERGREDANDSQKEGEEEKEKAVHASLTTLWLALMFDEWFKEQFAFVFIQQYRPRVEE
ncbi:zinc finger in n-recognin protein [Cystoisospora suis]|uniref:E3 ubiquitin-protein ligase n=1 Tax=Cystoisospora suis TaxID=483139 RepID=A0A2C6L0C5_9APIC|nr:zinc finger in n-recognin protein [Cystoisospora suis]